MKHQNYSAADLPPLPFQMLPAGVEVCELPHEFGWAQFEYAEAQLRQKMSPRLTLVQQWQPTEGGPING